MASSPTDTLTAIGDGTKLLLDSLARIYGPHIQKRIVVGLKLIDTTKDNRALKTMAIDVDTLRTMMEFVCRNIRRRHLIGLYLVFDRMTKMSVFDMAIMSDLVAQTLAILAIQLHTRRRRPVSRTSSIGGAFDKLHSGWCTHGIATFIGAATADLLGKMVVKGELS
jgi:hypothetical protein